METLCILCVDGPVLVQPKNLQKCGGKCGEAKCTALFESKEDLSRHINAITPTKMPQCRSVSLKDK